MWRRSASLRLRASIETELIQFADTVDDRRNFRAETGLDLLLRRRGIFNDVVHERGCDALIIEMQVRQDTGDRNWVRYVRFTGVTPLTFMSLGAELVCVDDDSQLRIRQVPNLA